MEHFEELLNRPASQNPPDIQPADQELPIDNNKAAGLDGIPAEALNVDTKTSVEMLFPLFKKICEEETVPHDWKEGYLIKLPKKGNLSQRSNYTRITLLSIPGKVLNRVILNRMTEHVDPILRDQQAGFRKGRSCTDKIATLRIIMEQSLEWNTSLYVNFIDYEKGFNSLDRQTLRKLLKRPTAHLRL